MPSLSILVITESRLPAQTRLLTYFKMRTVIAFLALSGAAAFAPAPAQRSATALNAQKPA